MSDIFQPLVSIVIPVYNGSNYMREAIDSAIAQTYQNIEIIVVNDGSNDNGKTREIALSYGDKIRYFEKENGGVSTALNLGIKEMRGEYFSWLSHDDVYYPNKISRQIEELNKLEDKKTIIYSDYEIINEKSNKLYNLNLRDQHEYRKLNNGLYATLNGCLNGCCMLISKEIFDFVGLFDPKLKYTQDYDLWFRFFSENYKVYFIDELLLKSRVHENQDSKKSFVKNECNDLWINFIKKINYEEYKKIDGNKYNVLNKIYTNIKQNLNQPIATDFAKNILDEILEKNINDLGDPLVSIILTCYNQQNFIEDAIKSVLENNYNNYELLIINDNSFDISKDIIDKYKSFNKIKIFHLPKNKGVSFVRNFGIENSRGQLIQFLDGDDILLPNKIIQQVNHLKLNPNLDISYTNFKYFYLKQKIYVVPKIETLEIGKKQFETLLFDWQNPISIPIHTFLFKKECFIDIRFDENYSICEDYLVWLKISKKNFFYEFINIYGCVYNVSEINSCSNYLKVFNQSSGVFLNIYLNLIEDCYSNELYFNKLKFYKQYIGSINIGSINIGSIAKNYYFFNIPIIKIITKHKDIKIKLFCCSFLNLASLKNKGNKAKVKFLGLPIFKIFYKKNGYKIKLIFSFVTIFSKKIQDKKETFKIFGIPFFKSKNKIN
jgi:glycosyltransferase involved in cell wall biosynthesis